MVWLYYCKIIFICLTTFQTVFLAVCAYFVCFKLSSLLCKVLACCACIAILIYASVEKLHRTLCVAAAMFDSHWEYIQRTRQQLIPAFCVNFVHKYATLLHKQYTWNVHHRDDSCRKQRRQSDDSCRMSKIARALTSYRFHRSKNRSADRLAHKQKKRNVRFFIP